MWSCSFGDASGIKLRRYFNDGSVHATVRFHPRSHARSTVVYDEKQAADFRRWGHVKDDIDVAVP